MVRCRICKKEFPDGSQGGWDNNDPNLTCGNCIDEPLPNLKNEGK